MSTALAVPAGGRRVVVCCGGHRPARLCGCCLECPSSGADPVVCALLARGLRAHNASLRMALRRAFHAACAAAVEEHLAPLAAATDAAVHVLTPDLPHLEGSL